LENIEGFLKTNDIAQPTGSYINSGFCRYPIYIFNEEKLTEM